MLFKKKKKVLQQAIHKKNTIYNEGVVHLKQQSHSFIDNNGIKQPIHKPIKKHTSK